MSYKEYIDKRNTLMQEAKNLVDSGKIEDFKAKKQEIADLDKSWEEYASAQAEIRAMEDKQPVNNGLLNQEEELVGVPAAKTKADIFDTAEYKHAFMNFVCRNEAIPKKFMNEAGKTTAADAGAVIPTTIVKEIIRELKAYGNIYTKVRKLNVQGGVEIPILSLLPAATWIGEEASEAQKLNAKDKVAFNYYGLECKISQTLLVSVVTYDEFQAEFVNLAVEAVVGALEKAIITGSGEGQPKGIINETRIPEENVIEMTAAEFNDWKAWKQKVFKKMKKSYRMGEFIMAQSSFDAHIDSMTDTTGQPIARVNYGIDGGETYRFGGKFVETVEEEILPDFDTAEVGAVVAIFTQLKHYIINSNMTMTNVKWVDHDTNEVKNKVILIADGKLAVPYGTILIKKKA